MENAREEYKVVYQRISYYKANSFDTSFHNYLDSVIVEVANSAKTPQQFIEELDANYQKYLEIAANQEKQKKEEQNKKIEYSLGVGVLSVFGIAFILYGLFSFGRKYITDAIMMCILYALSAGLIAFSRLALAKKFEKISHVVTSFGLSLAYFTTFYSYIKKDIFGVYVCAVLIAVISIIALLLNRICKSDLIEIVAGLGVACVALPFVREGLESTFILLGGLIAFVNVIFYIFDAKYSTAVSKIIRTITMIVAGLCLVVSSDFSYISFWFKGGICLAFALVFAVGYIFNSKEGPVKYTCLTALSIFCLFLLDSKNKEIPALVASLLAVAIVSLILYLYNRKSEERWTGYIIFMTFVFFKSATFDTAVVSILMIFAALLISKLMIYKESEVLNVYDCVLTVFALFGMLYYYKNPLVYIIAIVAVAGCFIVKKYKLYHVIFTCIAMICFSFLNDALWLSVSFMIVALLLIGYGCHINKFEVRLSGLILSLIVCIKVALFDFRKADDFRRLIVFLVVGTIAITISIIYLYLEKKEREEAEAMAELEVPADNMVNEETAVSSTEGERVDE